MSGLTQLELAGRLAVALVPHFYAETHRASEEEVARLGALAMEPSVKPNGEPRVLVVSALADRIARDLLALAVHADKLKEVTS